jgi:hypothetical protein
MKEVLEKIAEAFVEQNRLNAEILKIWQIVDARTAVAASFAPTHYLASAFMVLKNMRDEFRAVAGYVEKYPDNVGAQEALRELRKVMLETSADMFPDTKIGLQVPTVEQVLEQVNKVKED